MNTTMRYRLPPEWVKQSAVILTWPRANKLWDNYLAEIDQTYVQLVKHITPREKVILTYFDKAHLQHIQSLLAQEKIDTTAINFYEVKTDDVWMRDYGPLTVKESYNMPAYTIFSGGVSVDRPPSVFKDDLPKLLDFKFNAWGSKYPGAQDDAATKTLYQLQAFGDLYIESIDLVLEGGSIEVDGEGSLLTTASCLLAKTRNPHLSREQLTEKLKKLLGLDRILWLEHGRLIGDDTDGHIDTLARFVDPHTICHISCDDPQDEHFSEIHAMIDELKSFKDFEGKPYRLIPLPWPRPHYKENGQRIPATYANFLIINGAVLMPTYDDPADDFALKQLQICFPDREIIGIPCSVVIKNYGSLHCITMQLPA